jgi:hypothetical protein
MRRVLGAAVALAIGLPLASCSSFSALVADSWPRWAGGMPPNVPPRPGAPGYDEFIAHQQPRRDGAPPAGAEQPPPDGGPQGAAQAAPAPAARPDAVPGGLY